MTTGHTESKSEVVPVDRSELERLWEIERHAASILLAVANDGCVCQLADVADDDQRHMGGCAIVGLRNALTRGSINA